MISGSQMYTTPTGVFLLCYCLPVYPSYCNHWLVSIWQFICPNMVMFKHYGNFPQILIYDHLICVVYIE